MLESIQQMTQPQSDQRNRKAQDPLPHLQLLIDIKSEVQSIRAELVEFKKDVSRAFPKDEDGLPDYVGHRKGHEKEDKAQAKREEFQVGFARDLIKWGGISFVGFIVGLVVTYFKGGGQG